MLDASQQAQRAYSTARGSTKTPRRIEYEALASITARMRAAAQDGAAGFPALARALYDNRRLWTIFGVHAASGSNPLPEELRAGLVSLSEFVHQHSSKVLQRSASVEALLDINATVMRGLRDGTR